MSDNLILQRWSNHPDHGTMGEIFYAGEKIVNTIERPWENNEPFVSCVPHGTYELITFKRSNGDNVYALYNPELNVYVDPDERPNDYGRYAILIHVANWAEELGGCIAPGLDIGIGRPQYRSKKPNRMMVQRSTAGTKKLFDLIKSEQIEYITILEVKGE